MPEISTGIPTVTPEQAVSKAQRIVMNIYDSAVELSPLLTLSIFVIGGTVGVIYREARKLVLWSILGLLLILWAPQLVGLATYYRGL